jgi:hypothetical protein
MPIVYVHGVATRAADASKPVASKTVTTLMQRYLSPVISPGREVAVEYAYWGDVAAKFAWEGASRPRTPLLGQGGSEDLDTAGRVVLAAEMSRELGKLPDSAAGAPANRSLVPAGPRTAAGPGRTVLLKDLAPGQLSDFLAATVSPGSDTEDLALLLIAADEVAHDPDTPARLAQAADADAEWVVLARAIEERLPEAALAGMGGGGRLARLGDRVRESLDRGAGVPGYVASRMAAEFRRPLNDIATMFVGDVLVYLNHRGDTTAVGEIPRRFLDALRRATDAATAGEPVVVVSHSMGGQIVYDAVTTFLPKMTENRGLRVDYWCATASQVGLFEELKLFLASSQAYAMDSKVPYPDRRHLGGWWNVWDHNDFISYTGKAIFDGVDDEPFDAGMTLAGAHSGYLIRPSFYRRLAGKLAQSAASGWHR